MIGRMPDLSKPLQFATTDLLTVPESNVLNAALALVRAKQKQLGEMFIPFLRDLACVDPDMARLLQAAAALDRLRKRDKKLREEHSRKTRSVRGGHTFVDLSDPYTNGGTVVVSGNRAKKLPPFLGTRRIKNDPKSYVRTGTARKPWLRPDDAPPQFTNPGLV